jgi:hypothetical protein
MSAAEMPATSQPESKPLKRERRRKGGQPGNVNSVTHGLYLDATIRRQDGRKTIPKALKQAQAELARAIGGAPSPQELVLINRTVFCLYRVVVLEGLLGNDRTFSRDDLYLRYTRELRENLRAIGLQERQTQVINLREYLATSAAEDSPTAQPEGEAV